MAQLKAVRDNTIEIERQVVSRWAHPRRHLPHASSRDAITKEAQRGATSARISRAAQAVAGRGQVSR
jgi:hypothetical protein